MNNNRLKGINEIHVKLLPERNKRDYVLRVVSSIIIMAFFIVNFFMVFLPRTNLTAQINDINRNLYSLNSIYNNKLEVFKSLDSRNTKDYKENSNISKIEIKMLDMDIVLNTLDHQNNLPINGFIESVKYSEVKSELSLSVQFNSSDDLYTYKENLEKIDYIKSVSVGNQIQVKVPEGKNRVKTTLLISIDAEKSPRVGDINE